MKAENGSSDKVKELQDKLDLIEAIGKARKWFKQRKWLIKNRMDVNKFIEESEF